MKTEIVENGNQVIAKFSGRLDTAAAVQTAEDVKPLLEAEHKEIVLERRHPPSIHDDRLHQPVRH